MFDELLEGQQDIPKETPDNMLQQPRGLLLHQLTDHVAEYSSNSIEPLVGGTDIVETVIVEQYLLDDENSNSLRQLGPSLHDSETQRNDLGREKEVDDFGRVVFDERANDAQARQTEVLEWTRLGRGVQKWVEVERNVSCKVSS